MSDANPVTSVGNTPKAEEQPHELRTSSAEDGANAAPEPQSEVTPELESTTDVNEPVFDSTAGPAAGALEPDATDPGLDPVVVDDTTESEEPAVVEDVDPYDEALARVLDLRSTLDDLELQFHQAEHGVDVKGKRLRTNRAKVDKIRVDVANLTNARDSLATWLHERSSSLALGLLDHVDEQERAIAQDEERVALWASRASATQAGRARELRRQFVRSLWWSTALAILVPVGLALLNAWLEGRGAQLPLLGSVTWHYVVLGVFVLALITFLGLLRYHRGYAAMRTELDRSLANGRFLLSAISQIRTEKARLDGLTPQLRERLQFWSAVLHEPWRVPDYGATDGNLEQLAESLPALLQVAASAPSSDPSVLRLEVQFTAEHYRSGVRRDAVGRLLALAAERAGLGDSAGSLKAIDRDGATVGLRAAMYEAVRDPDTLESLGRARVSEIAAHIQQGLGPTGDRPGVELCNSDALQGLRVSQDLLSQWASPQQAWDEFVCEVLELSPALSLLAFSSLGRASGRHLAFESVAVAPARLRGYVGDLVAIHVIEGSAVTGTEVVSRLDITAPMNVDQVALFVDTLDLDGTNDAALRAAVIAGQTDRDSVL